MTSEIRSHAHRARAATPCAIVPPHLLDRLTRAADPSVYAPARRTLVLDAAPRAKRQMTARIGQMTARIDRPWWSASPAIPHRTICDAQNLVYLPGARARGEGGPPVPDSSVNNAYDGLGATFDFYLKALNRSSLDGNGLPLLASVHFDQNYDNAFWDGEQMVFGDGDGITFGDFTQSLDVIGHELTHGVTQYTANLEYVGQSGALNEHLSDVFGSLVEQYTKGQTTAQANWLIGEELLLPGVAGVALRSMKAPGTAYNDPVLGQDPQPAHMRDYVYTFFDHGGVHINSGIPNHAFYLAATQLGGYAWDHVGRIWYDVLTGGGLPPNAGFVSFAELTTNAAGAYGPHAQEAVLRAWAEVGVGQYSQALSRVLVGSSNRV
ncbi:M4 family metallopeptidase [Streptomyces sp. HC44]|uniref:Neutral metalloproteinase n=1 Tax=Streptomyces scabichelini TaxID=2711217 RepID=A0A6G4V9U7_9ACTN|nr:M4 family metallopeptidase [Streptomyces scabichelini]NGO10892.1 M4 family metallopeptidase [Streptomyces scabichelini]